MTISPLSGISKGFGISGTDAGISTGGGISAQPEGGLSVVSLTVLSDGVTFRVVLSGPPAGSFLGSAWTFTSVSDGVTVSTTVEDGVPGGVSNSIDYTMSVKVMSADTTLLASYSASGDTINGLAAFTDAAVDNDSAQTPTYATWNPADKNANITLSGGDLTGVGTVDGVYVSMRATVGLTSGKWRWRIIYEGGGQTTSGVATADAPLNNYIGVDADGWSVFNVSAASNNGGAPIGTGYLIGNGEVIEFLLDLDGDTLEVTNASQNTTIFTFDISGRAGASVFPSYTSLGTGNGLTAQFNPASIGGGDIPGYRNGVYS